MWDGKPSLEIMVGAEGEHWMPNHIGSVDDVKLSGWHNPPD